MGYCSVVGVRARMERVAAVQVHCEKALRFADCSWSWQRAFAHASIDLTAREASELAELIHTPRQFVV